MKEKIQPIQSVLLQEALFLFDQGIKTVLSDATTRRVISPYSVYSPITDRQYLAEMCEKYPEANLDIVVDRKIGIAVLGVGIDPGKENGLFSFWKLIEKYGSPNTLAYQQPDGTKYYLFKSDMEEPELDQQSGIRFLKDADRIYSYPSVIDGQPVEKLGDTNTIKNLSDWVAGKGEINRPSQGIVEGIGAGEVETTAPESSKPNREVADEPAPVKEILPADTYKEEGTITAVDSVDALRGEITSWVADGSNKTEVLTKALDWNRGQVFPVKVDDLVNLVDALDDTSAKEVETLAGEDLLFKLAEDTTLFHDDLSEPYFFHAGEPFKAPSKDYEAQVQYRYYKQAGEMPKPKALKNVLNILQSKARFEGKRISLKNRVAVSDEGFVYDLRDKRYIKTTAEKWEIIPAHPLFRRFNHQQPQVEPLTGGDPWKIFDIIPVAEENRLLILVYLISLFIPGIAHPVLALFGDKGSAKSFICTVINKLVDPTLTDRVILQKNDRDLLQTVRQKYVTVLDNLSKFSDVVSDILCQVCTGGSISFRKLYTDEGENIAQFRHVVILNSIKLAIVNPDLMDRSIILKYQRISQEDRRPEDELWTEFEASRPEILGGVFDTLVKAKAIYPSVKLDKLPRLADFAKWGYAIAEALGQSGEQFIEDFSENVNRQNQNVAESNVLCEAVIQLMTGKETFVRSVADTHKALKAIAGEDAKDSTFPKLPHNLRGDLDVLKTTLAEHNISYQYLDRTSSGVRILFTKAAAQASPSPFEPEPLRITLAQNVPGVTDVPEGELPIVEFDEMPEVING